MAYPVRWYVRKHRFEAAFDTVQVGDSKDEVIDQSRHLRDQLSREMQRQLVEADKSKPPSKPLQAALIDELNRLLKRPDLFNEQLLMQVNLTDEIRSLIERNPQGERLVQLNRLILVAIYPNEIVAKQRA